MRNKSFASWLYEQRGREHPTGDLARNVEQAEQTGFDEFQTAAELREHLIRTDTAQVALNVLDGAEIEYLSGKDGLTLKQHQSFGLRLQGILLELRRIRCDIQAAISTGRVRHDVQKAYVAVDELRSTLEDVLFDEGHSVPKTLQGDSRMSVYYHGDRIAVRFEVSGDCACDADYYCSANERVAHVEAGCDGWQQSSAGRW